MRFINVFSVLAFAFYSSVSQAAISNTPKAVPKNLHVYSVSGSTYVDLVPHDCSGTRYYIKSNHVRYDQIFSMILTAQMAGRKVSFRVDGCNSNNQGQIVGVYLD